jgi:hypothetical protein
LDRGGALSDKILLVIVSATVAAFVHILPSLSKNKVVWLVWAGCLVATVYSHVSFFENAQGRAGEERAQKSLATADIERQIDLVTRARDTIVTRPVTSVTALLAVTQDWKTRVQLKAELSEAKRAIELTNQLVALNDALSKTHITAGTDRVTLLLSSGTSTSTSKISLIVGVFLSCLIDLAGVLLWREIFVSGTSSKIKKEAQVTLAAESQKVEIQLPSVKIEQAVLPVEPVAQIQHGAIQETNPDKTIQELQRAIKAGNCKNTIRAIREFAGCGQGRAVELQKQLGVV